MNYINSGSVRSVNGIVVPADFPIVDIMKQGTPAAGHIFLSTWIDYPCGVYYYRLLTETGFSQAKKWF